MRRLASILVAVVLAANALAWPGFALAESFEHQHEVVEFGDSNSAPTEPGATHGHHGCAGHYGQHFQGQHAGTPALSPQGASEVPDPSIDLAAAQHVPFLSLRPPLAALIQS